ncbi:septum formation initiator family protein [Streptomyces sp. NPDC053048]|uniref:septum formation initiator family protein n=1 Tax=Streptomyces sp. NPDC053048 TaxID=3365694 RepID=UPI0037D986D5
MTPAARRGTRLGRLLPGGPAGAKRTPFVLLVVVLLGSGLISLLLLNSSLNQGSFELSRLQRKTTELTDEQQALQQEVDQLAAPDALERRARDLGMVPGGSPAFLNPDGTVSGVPAPAGADGPADPASFTGPAPLPRAPEDAAAPDTVPSPAAPPVATAPSPAAPPAADAPAPVPPPAAVQPPAPARTDGTRPPAVPAPPLPPAPAAGHPEQIR